MFKHLFVTIDFPPKKGGVATYISHVCKEFSHDMLVLSDEKYAKNKNPDQVEKSYYIVYRNFYHWARLFLLIPYLRYRYHIKYIHISHILPLGYVTFVLRKILGFKYVIYLHGMDISLTQKKWYKRFLTSLILKNAHCIISNSNFTKNLVRKFYPKITTKHIIAYPCPQSFCDNHDNKNNINFQNNSRPIRLITVSRIVRRKGHIYILKIMKKLLEKYPAIKYYIVGDGIYKEQLQEYVNKNGLKNHVLFFGSVSQQGLEKLYKESDIFVMPTIANDADVEGFGIVYLEANQFGLPVIGGKSGGVVEAIEHGKSGFTIDPESSRELFDTIDSLLSNKDLYETISEYGKKRVGENFTWKKQVQKIKNELN